MTSSSNTGCCAPVHRARDLLVRAGCATLLAAMLAGCASRAPAGPREYLDERTAATITVAGDAMIFSYDRPELGVNARDYVTLTAVDVNNSGRHATHLVGYAWSTIDKRGVEDGASKYDIVAADRTLPLAVAPEGFRSIGVNEPPIPVPSRSALPLSAPVTREQVQFMLDTPDVRVVRTRDGVMERFEVWSAPGH